MKVLLVSLFNDEAYGTRCIHAHLVEKNIDAKMMFFKSPRHHGETQEDKIKTDFIGDINTASQNEIDLLVRHIIDSKYDLVGFSLVSQHFSLYKKIYKKIKDIDGLTVVIGGWQSSLNPEDSIHYADYLCIGEGEEPLAELIGKMENNIQTENIENFWTKTDDGIIRNPVRCLPSKLSSFPIPVYEKKFSYIIENNTLKNHEPYHENPRYGTFIGRGCPYKCTYCSNSYMASKVYPGSWSKIRYRDIGHVQKELMVVKERLKNVKSINFYDEVFTPPMKWIREFFSWYKKKIDIPFFCFFFPGTCSDEKAKVLANAGMKGVWVGVQSGSERVRKEVFKRNYSNETVMKQTKIFHKYNINVRYDFIFDNPFESFEESLESIYLMLDLPQPFSLNTFSLKYFPNTEITEMARSAGLIRDSDTDDNLQTDEDHYLIRQNTGDINNRFINNLAFYIANICSTPKLTEQKAKLYKLIDRYKISPDLTEIEGLISPYVQ